MKKRERWDFYFMRFAYLAASRTTCIRRKVGAALVKDKQVVATGYNGNPRGIEHCATRGCIRNKLDIPSGTRHEVCTGLHAEQNLIIQAARTGVRVRNCTLYCTTRPCIICAKMIINADIEKVFFVEHYPDELSDRLLHEAGIPCYQLKVDFSDNA